MRQFKEYLRQKNFQPYTIHSAIQTVKLYRRWLIENGNSTYRADHSTAVEFIDYLQGLNKYTTFTINLKLAHLRHYYNSLARKRNPFENLKVRGQTKRVRAGWLKEDELTTMYMNLEETNLLEQRAKLLAGFYIFQGVSTRDISELKVSDLLLTKGQVIIPHTQRGNERTLSLHPLQMMLLTQQFYGKHHALDKYIYQVLGEADQYQTVVRHMTGQLRKQEGFESLLQLRHSVIRNWLKSENLRQVQYMAGHRYIKTTEKYLESDYESLRLVIVDKHPLG